MYVCVCVNTCVSKKYCQDSELAVKNLKHTLGIPYMYLTHYDCIEILVDLNGRRQGMKRRGDLFLYQVHYTWALW